MHAGCRRGDTDTGVVRVDDTNPAGNHTDTTENGTVTTDLFACSVHTTVCSADTLATGTDDTVAARLCTDNVDDGSATDSNTNSTAGQPSSY